MLLIHIELDPANFVRMWMAGLFHRAIDGYHATLALREIELDVDARAHMRIAFEHLCAFAWVAAEPENIGRPLRIARFGMEFQGRHFEELARFYTLTESQLRELGFATQIEESKLKKPPPARVICEELDREWGGKLPSMDAGTSASFGAWYSHIFRGASAFVHPSSRGIEPLLFRSPGLFVLEPSRARELRILELCAMHLSVAVGIASLSYPELIHDGPLQEIADLAAI
jgi:hypothetical protein